jgi:hypothetical protein
MQTIPIKSQSNPQVPGETFYTVPAMGLRAPEGIRMIPHPYGHETGRFETLEKAIEQVHRAGYTAEYDGLLYPQPTRSGQQSVQKSPPHASDFLPVVPPYLAEAVPFLVKQLSDTAPNVVAAAAMALGDIGDPATVKALLPTLGHEDAGVRKASTDALSRLGEGALKAILAALTDVHWLVRHSALASLTIVFHQQPDRIAELLRPVLPLLQDEHWLVRSQAAHAVSEAARITRNQS